MTNHEAIEKLVNATSELRLIEIENVIKTITKIFDKHINDSKTYPKELFEMKTELIGALMLDEPPESEVRE